MLRRPTSLPYRKIFMRSSFDFSSWSSLLSTLLGLLLMTCLMMGVRLLFMHTVQKRRERENRQINERLKTLIAAYKTLGSSFTGTLSVNPEHLRDLKNANLGERQPVSESLSERRRRIRDAVEAALSDIILLGTEEQVEMAARAAQDMVEGRPIETSALVASLRSFIRQALDLEPISPQLLIPPQGPARPSQSSGGNRKTGDGQTGAGARNGNSHGGGAGMSTGPGLMPGGRSSEDGSLLR